RVRGAAVGPRGRLQGLRRELRGRGPSREAQGGGAGARRRGVRRRRGGVVRRRRGQAPEPAPPPPLPTPPDAGRARTALGPNAFGPLLLGLGALFLVDRFAWAVGIRRVLWALLFAAGAAAVLVLYARDRRHWRALYPGFGLVALAAAVVAGNVGGGLLLGLAGAACIVLFLRESGGRWLLLVGGALVSLALMSLLEGAFPRLDNGWVLFAGLAATL